MEIYRKIKAECNFTTLKKFYDMLRNGILCEMVILVVFKVFLVVKNLENFIQIVPDSPIYYY